VQALRKRVDVIHHRAEQLEVGLRVMFANFAQQVEQAMQHGSQGLVFRADDSDRFHGRFGGKVPCVDCPVAIVGSSMGSSLTSVNWLESRRGCRHVRGMSLDIPRALPADGAARELPPDGAPAAAASESYLQDAYSRAVIGAVARVAPAVAHVGVERAKAPRGAREGAGSGFLLTPDGYL